MMFDADLVVKSNAEGWNIFGVPAAVEKAVAEYIATIPEPELVPAEWEPVENGKHCSDEEFADYIAISVEHYIGGTTFVAPAGMKFNQIYQGGSVRYNRDGDIHANLAILAILPEGSTVCEEYRSSESLINIMRWKKSADGWRVVEVIDFRDAEIQHQHALQQHYCEINQIRNLEEMPDELIEMVRKIVGAPASSTFDKAINSVLYDALMKNA